MEERLGINLNFKNSVFISYKLIRDRFIYPSMSRSYQLNFLRPWKASKGAWDGGGRGDGVCKRVCMG